MCIAVERTEHNVYTGKLSPDPTLIFGSSIRYTFMINMFQNVVSMLHGVLLTATELFILRDQLRMLEGKVKGSRFVIL